MAVRKQQQAAPEAGEPGELAEVKAALQAIARVTANVAARVNRTPWTDFQRLLTDQYGVTHADAELFREILAGRKP
jgi:hypothetical protein